MLTHRLSFDQLVGIVVLEREWIARVGAFILDGFDFRERFSHIDCLSFRHFSNVQGIWVLLEWEMSHIALLMRNIPGEGQAKNGGWGWWGWWGK